MLSQDVILTNGPVTEDGDLDESMLEIVCGDEIYGLLKDITLGRTIKGAVKG